MTDSNDNFDDLFEGWLDRHRVEPLSPAPGVYERVARSARRRRTVRVSTLVGTQYPPPGGVSVGVDLRPDGMDDVAWCGSIARSPRAT